MTGIEMDAPVNCVASSYGYLLFHIACTYYVVISWFESAFSSILL